MGIWAVLALTFSASSLPASDTVTIPGCSISADEESLVPAQESGMLTHIYVREGQEVTAGRLLAQIDDVIPRMRHEVATNKLKVAQKQATDDIDVRYANAAYKVADAKLDRSLKANHQTSHAVSDEVVDEQKLEKEKFWLSIAKAQKDLDVAMLQENVSAAEDKAAAADEDHRKIFAPFDGVVIDLLPHKGEWLQMGDPVLKVVNVRKLRVQGFLNPSQYRPADVQNRNVSVEVKFPGEPKPIAFNGRVVYVKPALEMSGDFLVRAEIDNVQLQNGSWLISPGMTGDMVIYMK
jgi:multidrug resistance efflux pump